MNLIFCKIDIFHYMEDLIKSILPKINGQYFHVESISFNPEFKFEKSNNYIFIQNIPEHLISKVSDKNVYIFNTEQLSYEKNIEKLSLSMLNNNELINFIDYSYSNLKKYSSIKHNKKFFLPYQINYKEIYDIKKNNDICIIGFDLLPYRQHIINLLKDKNINVDLVSGFGTERDKILFQYKIILNISAFNYFNTFESLRCDRCVYNKMIVISDFKEDIEKYYLKDHIIFEKYQDIPDKVVDVINNYEYYYNKLFKDFNFEKIEKIINENSKEVLEILNN